MGNDARQTRETSSKEPSSSPGRAVRGRREPLQHFIVDRLVEGALDALVRHGADAKNVTVVRVPGAWELPLVVRRLAASKKVDAVIALGAVIRGATPHFDYVAGEAAKGIGAGGRSDATCRSPSAC